MGYNDRDQGGQRQQPRQGQALVPQNDAMVPDADALKSVPAAQGGNSRAVFMPTNFGDAMQMAKLMSSGVGVRPWMRGNISACMMVLQQALRWGMDPYAVANKSYYTNDTLSFESQLVNAVINTSGELHERLAIEWAGDAHAPKGQETLVCRVSGRLRAAPNKILVLDQALCDITIRNSPIWTVNPQLQLAYHTTRSWARLYMPEVLLGVYTPDEITDGAIIDATAQTLPASEPAPDRRDFAESVLKPSVSFQIPTPDGENAEFSPVDEQNVAEIGSGDVEKAESGIVPPEASASAEAGAQPTNDQSGTIVNQPDLDIPEDADAWEVWRTSSLRDITGAADLKALSDVRQEIVRMEDHAPGDIMDEVQDAIADRVVELAE